MTLDGQDRRLPVEAYLAALCSLDGMGPARLQKLLAQWTPSQIWDALGTEVVGGPTLAAVDVAAGKRGLGESWRSGARDVDLAERWAMHRSAGVGVLSREAAAFPSRLRDDIEPPVVLFTKGDMAALEQIGPDGPAVRPSVGIVGTRRCTRYGYDIAFELGALLAAAGVAVISGLASGIDAAAHAGALSIRDARPVGIVGTGLDVPYPRSNAALWADVAATGLLCSEAPLGARADRWRFPARNRIIAALSDVVVVVESGARGGSLYTAHEAIERDRPVLAVPGPIRSASSAGTNALLADGCQPMCDPAEVLSMLDLVTAPPRGPLPVAAIDARQAAILDAIGWEPTLPDAVAAQTRLDIGSLALAIEELIVAGVVARRGPWLERTAMAVRFAGPSDPSAGGERHS